MIELMIKNVFDNGNRIDAIAKYINKMDKRYCWIFLLMSTNIFVASQLIRKNKEKIEELEARLNGIESKLA